MIYLLFNLKHILRDYARLQAQENERLAQGKMHDGKLDEQKHAWVRYLDKIVGEHGILIERDEWENDSIRLDPAQALSLLAWLKQEEATLRQLAKEQE